MFEHRPFGRHLQLVIRGASHAPAIRFELERFPGGLAVDAAELRTLMERRAPGRDDLSTTRSETDEIQWLSGVVDGRTTGDKIIGQILNSDMRPEDYGAERTIPRPGHADFGQWIEQGRIPSGGGANSGRMTAAFCAAGGPCLQWLRRRGISVSARMASIGGKTEKVEDVIRAARQDGDSVGGIIACEVNGVPAGLGGAMFAGLESEISAAIFGIPGVKGVEFGNGFAAANMRGSENDDAFAVVDGRVTTETNRHGGILGGRASGAPLTFQVAMKPTPTIFKPLASVDLATMLPAECMMKGRHDPCVVRRALPVVEAMTAFAIADRIMATEAATSRICLTLTGRTLAEDWQQLEEQRLFVDMLELRVDLLEAGERGLVREFIAKSPVPVIVTFRRKRDGGEFEGTESERIAFYQGLLSKPLPSAPEVLVDFEDDFRVEELTALTAIRNVRIVRSLHLFEGSVPNVEALIRQLVAGTNEIAKLAIMPKSAAEVADYMHSAAAITDTPHIICIMGGLGIASRALAVRLGSLWTYASVGGLGQLGHLSPQELVRTYRFRIQERHFRLYGVAGWPVRASRSPELHNRVFADSDQDAIMAPFPAETASEVVTCIRKLNISGMAVTIPHKENIMPLLDEIAPEAKEIGAVNTVVNDNGRLIGHNTDALGFTEALQNFLGRKHLEGLRIAVLGDGGASKAVVYALRSMGGVVEVFHRRELDKSFDVIVNATPVDPIPGYVFTGREAVYDLVYVPAETPLIARARAAGCRVENGLSMLRAQARLQREIWGCK